MLQTLKKELEEQAKETTVELKEFFSNTDPLLEYFDHYQDVLRIFDIELEKVSTTETGMHLIYESKSQIATDRQQLKKFIAGIRVGLTSRKYAAAARATSHGG